MELNLNSIKKAAFYGIAFGVVAGACQLVTARIATAAVKEINKIKVD